MFGAYNESVARALIEMLKALTAYLNRH